MNTLSIATAVICVIAPMASLAQDAANGEQLFKKCAACHKVGDGAKNGIGPVLTDVIGRKAGTFEGYKFSKTLIAAGEQGLIWDTALVADYIADPRAFMRSYLDDRKAKPKMTFKLKKEADRIDVVAYLASLADTTSQTTNPAMTTPDQDIASVPGAVCVVNGSPEVLFFTVENADGVRDAAELKRDEFLCSETAENGAKGTVSVYESADAFEGCSRRVASGDIETMFRYSEFDRCAWSSNQG